MSNHIAFSLVVGGGCGQSQRFISEAFCGASHVRSVGFPTFAGISYQIQYNMAGWQAGLSDEAPRVTVLFCLKAWPGHGPGPMRSPSAAISASVR